MLPTHSEVHFLSKLSKTGNDPINGIDGIEDGEANPF
jgi:hypothetical protein